MLKSQHILEYVYISVTAQASSVKIIGGEISHQKIFAEDFPHQAHSWGVGGHNNSRSNKIVMSGSQYIVIISMTAFTRVTIACRAHEWPDYCLVE